MNALTSKGKILGIVAERPRVCGMDAAGEADCAGDGACDTL
jgi:hypothetical protein